MSGRVGFISGKAIVTCLSLLSSELVTVTHGSYSFGANLLICKNVWKNKNVNLKLGIKNSKNQRKKSQRESWLINKADWTFQKSQGLALRQLKPSGSSPRSRAGEWNEVKWQGHHLCYHLLPLIRCLAGYVWVACQLPKGLLSSVCVRICKCAYIVHALCVRERSVLAYSEHGWQQFLCYACCTHYGFIIMV